jgi:hypothetical protein
MAIRQSAFLNWILKWRIDPSKHGKLDAEKLTLRLGELLDRKATIAVERRYLTHRRKELLVWEDGDESGGGFGL